LKQPTLRSSGRMHCTSGLRPHTLVAEGRMH
jgi:hypothetical protein